MRELCGEVPRDVDLLPRRALDLGAILHVLILLERALLRIQEIYVQLPHVAEAPFLQVLPTVHVKPIYTINKPLSGNNDHREREYIKKGDFLTHCSKRRRRDTRVDWVFCRRSRIAHAMHWEFRGSPACSGWIWAHATARDVCRRGPTGRGRPL